MQSNHGQSFLSHNPSPALRPSEKDIQNTLDTLEKETERTYVYNSSSVFRNKVEQRLERSSSDSSNTSSVAFLDDSTEDALNNLREWVRRNDPILHKSLLVSENHGTIPLILDLCNQLCEKATKKSSGERSPKLGRHEDLSFHEDDTNDDTKALDLVVKILMDATHEGNVQQTAHAVALQFLASPDPDDNARGTQAFLPDNYGPEVLTKVLRQHTNNAHLQKHGWATFDNVMDNAPGSLSIDPLESLNEDSELIQSLIEASLTSLQIHQRNPEVIHVLLNTMGTMIHKLPLFRLAFLDHKELAFEILNDIHILYATDLENDNGAKGSTALHDFLSVTSRWLRLAFYLTRTSKTTVVGESIKPSLSQDNWKMMIGVVTATVSRLPLTYDGDKTQEAHTFLCWLQIQLIQKMACGFFETCLQHGINKENLIEAGALSVLSMIAETSSSRNQKWHPEAIADEATKAQAKQVIKEIVG